MATVSSYSSVVPDATPLSLREAFERCRAETAEWAKTFYLGTLLMPLEKRQAIWAIYVWCRRTDEIMDSPEALSKSKEQLLAELDAWEHHTLEMFEGCIDTWLDKVMVDTIHRFGLHIQPHLQKSQGSRHPKARKHHHHLDQQKVLIDLQRQA